MVALWSIGYVLEKRLPRLAFIGIYFCSGLAGSLLSALVHSGGNVVSCGASGAILGLAGALLACLFIQRSNTRQPLLGLIVSILLTFGLGLVFPVDNVAHIGGLISGFILGALTLLVAKKARATRPWLAHLLLVFMFCLPIAGMRYLYLQKAIPDGAEQIQSAKLILTLSALGNGGSSSMVTGLHAMNTCIENQLQETTSDLSLCAERQAYVSARVMELLLSQQLSSCLAAVEALRNAYAAPTDRQKLQTIHDYCSVRKYAYHDVYNPPTSHGVSASAWQKTESAMKELASHIHLLAAEKEKQSWGYDTYFDEQEPEQNASPLGGVLNDLHPAVYKAVHDGQCPYYTCEKLH